MPKLMQARRAMSKSAFFVSADDRPLILEVALQERHIPVMSLTMRGEENGLNIKGWFLCGRVLSGVTPPAIYI
jgi:hypothetical protein